MELSNKPKIMEGILKMKEANVNEILEHLSRIDVGKEGIRKISEILLNWLMQKEREYFLQQRDDNKANGYYTRSLASLFGNMNLCVHRDRKGLFRAALLPDQWQRSDSTFQEFVLKLILQSYSPARIKILLQSLNLPYSPEQINELKEELYLKACELRMSDKR